MLLPTVMEFNRMVRRARFSQIGRALTGKKPMTARLSPPCAS